MNQQLIIDLENFRILEKIGEGNYGIVYLVEEIETKKKYIAKESKIECKSSQDQRKFFNEISASLKANSPSVLSLFGFNLTNFEGDYYPIIITEYMPNGSLDKLLQKNPDFPSSKKYIILLGIAKGMECLHKHSIVHRDLKPANVLLDQYFYPHIGDFGESVVSDLTISSILMNSCRGTPAYMSPEVFLEEPYTYKADVFSFSIIMYELLTGKKPFEKYKSIIKLQMDMQNGKRPDISFIKDENIKSFLCRCWSSDANNRPDFKAILKEIQSERYLHAFNADKAEVAKYLQLFDRKTHSVSDGPLNKPRGSQDIKIKADGGDARAMWQIGLDLSQGRNGFEVNKKEALRYYKMSADKGLVEAMVSYALHVIHLKGTDEYEEKKEEAVRYCKIAIDKGNPKAMNIYGLMLSHGLCGLSVDKTAAAQFYKMAADKGNVKAMNSYAALVKNGNGVAPNKDEAIKYFQMAADRGNATAMFNLGSYILLSSDFAGSKEAGVRYIRMAAEKGMLHAMNLYAELLDKGVLVAKNQKEAERYRQMAIEAMKHKK